MARRKGLIWETAAQPTRVEAGHAQAVVIRHQDLTALRSSQRADKQEGLDTDNQMGQAEEGGDLSLEPVLGSVTSGFPSL